MASFVWCTMFFGNCAAISILESKCVIKSSRLSFLLLAATVESLVFDALLRCEFFQSVAKFCLSSAGLGEDRSQIAGERPVERVYFCIRVRGIPSRGIIILILDGHCLLPVDILRGGTNRGDAKNKTKPQNCA